MTTPTVTSPTNAKMSTFLKGLRDLILTETAVTTHTIVNEGRTNWHTPVKKQL